MAPCLCLPVSMSAHAEIEIGAHQLQVMRSLGLEACLFLSCSSPWRVAEQSSVSIEKDDGGRDVVEEEVNVLEWTLSSRSDRELRRMQVK